MSDISDAIALIRESNNFVRSTNRIVRIRLESMKSPQDGIKLYMAPRITFDSLPNRPERHIDTVLDLE